MYLTNEPREFTLTQENFLDTLLEWMPEQLHRMRTFQSGTIRIGDGFSSLECQYMHTVGGEKFRIVDVTPMGDSGSDYHPPVGTDEAIILAFASRVEKALLARDRRRAVFKSDSREGITMTFAPGPFEAAH